MGDQLVGRYANGYLRQNVVCKRWKSQDLRPPVLTKNRLVLSGCSRMRLLCALPKYPTPYSHDQSFVRFLQDQDLRRLAWARWSALADVPLMKSHCRVFASFCDGCLNSTQGWMLRTPWWDPWTSNWELRWKSDQPWPMWPAPTSRFFSDGFENQLPLLGPDSICQPNSLMGKVSWRATSLRAESWPTVPRFSSTKRKKQQPRRVRTRHISPLTKASQLNCRSCWVGHIGSKVSQGWCLVPRPNPWLLVCRRIQLRVRHGVKHTQFRKAILESFAAWSMTHSWLVWDFRSLEIARGGLLKIKGFYSVFEVFEFFNLKTLPKIINI